MIVALKVASFALTNRDLRDMYLENIPMPEQYTSTPYPENINLSNLLYFWWAPTLIYQPVYPRTEKFRWAFFLKRSGEAIGIIFALWFIIAQYATYSLTSVVALSNAKADLEQLDCPDERVSSRQNH